MTTAYGGSGTTRKPLRLWPGVLLAGTVALITLVLRHVVPDAMMFDYLGGAAAALAIVLWWLLFSRARWQERVSAVAFMGAAAFTIRSVLHESVAGAGQGVLFLILALQTMSVALVVWAAATRHTSRRRQLTMAASLVLACGAWALVRTEGVTGEGASQLHWRWSQTAEERLLEQVRHERLQAARSTPAPRPSLPPPSQAVSKTAADSRAVLPSPAPAAIPVPATTAVERTPDRGPARAVDAVDPALAGRTPVWPGFRGSQRDGAARGVRIATDWSAATPVEMWRRPVGPGWSSFAIDGDLVYTQEQHGDAEVVSCYRLSTGEPVWRHRDAARFWESNGGAGPRGTPTLSGGRVYALGATGILNALDAGSGAVIWSRNLVADTSRSVPDWGVASSPLLAGDVLVVAIGGQLAGYDARTGNLRWLGPTGGSGYSSPHYAVVDGVPQILFLRGARTIGVAPDDGSILWEHTWTPGASIVQPALTADGDVLINSADGMGGQGMRRLHIARGSAGWTVEERWTSRGLKPYFSDFVVHDGHAYGFDGNILACIDLQDGTRRWKGGRYGHGQLVLLPEPHLLLVISEDGELALVDARPDGFSERARFRAIEGKTWNHPALAGDVLLVRNGEEMAAFRLPLARR